MLSWPMPSVMPAFSTDECACSEVYITRPRRIAARAGFRIRHLARRRDGVQGADGSGVVDDAEEFLGQAHPLAQPPERHLFELGERGAALPQHAVDIEPGGQHLGENPRLRGRDGEVGEEARMVPVGQRGNDGALEVLQNRVHGLAVIRGAARADDPPSRRAACPATPDTAGCLSDSPPASPPPRARTAGILRCPLAFRLPREGRRPVLCYNHDACLAGS